MKKIIKWILKTILKNVKVNKQDVINNINFLDKDEDGTIDLWELIEGIL